ncbi:MAG TPA: hypothetical protein VHT68_10285 [Pseudolabrys sp.]|nr:hypothetical protein [Pseudolabrys sp.]
MADIDDDVRQIRTIVGRQFGALSWSTGKVGDWQTFAADFCDGATLFPAARPLKPQSVNVFLARMKNLAGGELCSLHEAIERTHIKVFGNVAIAAVLCAMTENENKHSQTVEMLLLVKDVGTWRIAAQAWDRVNDENPVQQGLF